MGSADPLGSGVAESAEAGAAPSTLTCADRLREERSEEKKRWKVGKKMGGPG